MLVLFMAIFLLFVAPAMLLYVGRFIQSRTDGFHSDPLISRGKPIDGTAWYFRPPRPIYGSAASSEAVSPIEAVETTGASKAGDADEWYYRPYQPIFAWPNMRKLFRR